jgi:hypothetical protein
MGISMQDLDSKIGGDNHRRLEEVLEERLPRAGTSQVRRGTAADCTARQSLMLHYARQSAAEMVENASSMLSSRADDQSVRQAVQCRFRGATEAQVGEIRGAFERVRGELTRRVYHCGAEGAGEIEGITVRGSDGSSYTIQCLGELATSFVRGSTTIPDVFMCAEFFRQSPEGQAITILHESVHAAGVLDDIRYQPDCGMNVDDALRNPDSYAYLAADLHRLLPRGALATGSTEPEPRLPTVTVGNFRNSGPLSPENECPVCTELPGLGLDTATGLNIMEVRGDISEHRSGVEYEFRRTKERVIWRRTDAGWEMLRYEPPGTDDDATDRDEDLTPRNNHIYAVDGPGLPDLSVPLGPHTRGAVEAVYKGSYVDFVEARIRNGPWSRVSNEFQWHSVTWLEKADGRWRRTRSWNEIEAGPMMIGTGLPFGPGDYPLPSPGEKTKRA